MAKAHNKEFKENAIKYYQEHQDLGVLGCSKNLGIGQSTLSRWLSEVKETGEVQYRGSGNYSSDDKKEIARLKRQLRDAEDALDVLKKAISILGK